MKKYEHKKIEKKWQKYWREKKIYRTKEGGKKPKCYVLDMFPYPSGEGLHVGHPRGYIATDVYSRFKRMNGFNVLHPMGFDSFGLPAENYAIKNKIHPEIAVKNNVKKFKKQLKLIGFDYDWEREIITSDSEFYKWTQWIFLKMFEKGLAYESYEPINFCPSCLTGLANEDVEDGKCERCATTVVKKPMRQWVLKITDYAERMLKDLDELKGWPEHIKEAQRNWIGKSEGVEISFKVKSQKSKVDDIKVFTTRIDTIFGVTYLVLALEHSIIKNLKLKIENFDEISKYIEEAKNKSELQKTDLAKEKTGVELKGIKAVNPFNNEEIPIFVADYVLGGYGAGAVMAVPAHDERDWEFAKKYNLPVKMVVCLNYPKPICPVLENAYTGEGHLVGSGEFSGMKSNEAREKMTKWLKDKKLGGKKTNYKLKDWVFSRQRYWGEPIPLIHCENCGIKEIKTKLSLDFHGEYRWKAIIDGKKTIETRALYLSERKNLKVGDLIRLENKKTRQTKIAKILEINIFKNLFELSKREDLIEKIFPDEKIRDLKSLEERYEIVDKGYVSKINEYGLAVWKIELINIEKIIPVPEKDLPVKLPKVKFYEPTDTGESPLVKIEKWVNVKCPKCGGKGKRETNTMPQWAGSSWYYLAYIVKQNSKFKIQNSKLLNNWLPIDMYVGGTEHATRHLIYARFWHKFLYDIGVVGGKEPFARLKNQGLILGSDNRKMSKRWGNIVNPDDVVKEHGADSLRLYEMFMGPFDQTIAWSTDNIVGARRFIEKVWKLQLKAAKFINSQRNFRLQYSVSAMVGGENLKYKINSKLEKLIHKTIKKVGEDIEAMKFNTAVSSLMILLNKIEKENEISKNIFETFLIILAPFAPHITEELWKNIGNKRSILFEKWPKYDKEKIENDVISIAIQINGKVRASIEIANDENDDKVKEKALSNEKIKKWISGKSIKKVLYIKDKIISIITN